MTYKLKDLALMWPELLVDFHWSGQDNAGNHVYRSDLNVMLKTCKQEGVITILCERAL